MIRKKILLALLPYWTPQIPPLGIACLKGFLQEHGYIVKTIDVNVEETARQLYDKYFETLKATIPEAKQGNFYNIGHDVFQNHMMAHFNHQNRDHYIELVKTLVYLTFYTKISTEQVTRLDQILSEFYSFVETYMLHRLEEEKPDVLGLSVYRGNLPAAVFTFKRTREHFPHIKTVMGGAAFAQLLTPGTANFDYFLETTKGIIDHFIIGEGENLFLKLLNGEIPPTQRVLTLKDISGQTMHLPSAPLPDFSDFNIDYYPDMASYTSRSCPFQCKFCTETVYWGNYRKKPAAQIINELHTLYKKYGIQMFLLSDSLLNPVINDLAQEFLAKDYPIYWDGYLRVGRETLDPEKAYLWRRGGYYRARIGVESGSQKVLEAMNKRIPLEDIATTIINLGNAGIKVTTYFIMGFPSETEDDFQKTLDFIEMLKDNIYEAECNPFGFYPEAQVSSAEWQKNAAVLPLYPETARDMLMLQSWIVDVAPHREEIYRRVSRFVAHCARLGVPNPYSIYDIYRADERWKKLHANAVPSLVEFKNKEVLINEARQVKKLCYINKTLQGPLDFDLE